MKYQVKGIDPYNIIIIYILHPIILRSNSSRMAEHDEFKFYLLLYKKSRLTFSQASYLKSNEKKFTTYGLG